VGRGQQTWVLLVADVRKAIKMRDTPILAGFRANRPIVTRVPTTRVGMVAPRITQSDDDGAE
jgi:hypothetical protein